MRLVHASGAANSGSLSVAKVTARCEGDQYLLTYGMNYVPEGNVAQIHEISLITDSYNFPVGVYVATYVDCPACTDPQFADYTLVVSAVCCPR